MNRIQTKVFRFAAIVFSLSLLMVSSALAQTATPEPAAQANPFGLEKAPPLPAGMTGSTTKDPRSYLLPGLFDAGEASFGMKHLMLLRKPEAFQLGIDPNSPQVKKALVAMGIPPEAPIPPAMKMPLAGLALANSDLAFQGKYLFLGNFYGINIYDISDSAKAKLVTSVICPGGQGDVSVHKNLMFMSVEMPNGRLDCGEQGFPPAMPAAGQTPLDGAPAADKARFRGVRIFDISDITNIKQVGAVQTCRGSHTHTLVPDLKDKDNVYIYVSGTSFVRQEDEMAGCSGGPPDKDPNTALFRIDVIKVPLAAPQNAKIVSSPRIFMDARTGALAGLSSAKTHGKDDPSPTDQCHDITVYPEIGLAAGACSGNGILLDIKNPADPKRIDAVNDPNYAYWHSAAFSNDGKKVVFTDEWGGGLGARCRENDPNKWGANAIFRLADNKLTFASYYKMPAAQGDSENCVAHNGSLVPVPGRDIKVQAWYQGGISVMDFTDADNPMEIAYFDRGPIDPKTLILGGSWSAYWYNGRIYSSEIARGLDILELTPTDKLSQNEIDAARSVQVAELNVQNQQKIVWPKTKVAALAYIDQLERSKSLSSEQIAELRNAVKARNLDQTQVAKLRSMLDKNAGLTNNRPDQVRFQALAEILRAPAL